MPRLPRLVASSLLRSWLCAALSAHLIYSPLLALPMARATAPKPLPPALSLPTISAPHQAGELLIKFRAEATDAQRKQIIERLAQDSKPLRGGSSVTRLKLKTGTDVPTALALLQSLDSVIEWAEPNYQVKRTADVAPRLSRSPNDPRFPEQWALRNTGRRGGVRGSDIGARGAWSITTGSHETVIAVIDTGVDTQHPDLKPNLWRNAEEAAGMPGSDDDHNGYPDDLEGWNFVSDNNDVRDDAGHGTMVAGLIAARGNNARGVTGVMPQASVLPLKALDATGTGTVAAVVEAMDFALRHHAAVINCSFSTAGNSKALLEAVNRAGMAGAIIVAAAGNDGQDIQRSPAYPASFQAGNLIAVAATTNGDQLAGFSNWNGTEVQVAAPGVGLLTTKRGGGYAKLTGTSAAAPLVSGVVGLLKAVRTWVSPQTVRERRMSTAMAKLIWWDGMRKPAICKRASRTGARAEARPRPTARTSTTVTIRAAG